MNLKKTLLILPLVLMACKENKESSNQTTEIGPSKTDSLAQSNSKNSFQLETFSSPEEIQGCSCYFATDKASFDKEQYIYVDDYGNSAFIKINGSTVKFKMEEGDFDPENFVKKLDNGDFLIEMTGKKMEGPEEVMLFNGSITVTNKKTGQKTTSPIYGECAC